MPMAGVTTAIDRMGGMTDNGIHVLVVIHQFTRGRIMKMMAMMAIVKWQKRMAT